MKPAIIAFVVILSAAFLGTAFVEATFNITDWSKGARTFCAALGLGLGLYIAGGIIFVRSGP